jgi:cell division protein FtsB
MKRLGLIIFCLALGYFIFLIRQDIINHLDLKGELTKAANSLKQEEQLSASLQKNLKLLTQNDYLERLARTRLGLINQGEIAYKVIFKK